MEPDKRYNSDQLEAINRLLIDYNKSQSNIISNLKNMILSITVAFTVIICAMIGGYFWYESQFDKAITTTIEQEAETDGDGYSIVNNGGSVTYGK